jgi:outer membrane lipoprotein-sorting protein
MSSGVTEDLNKIIHDEVNNLWIAVGANATVITSDDGGVTWTLIDVSSETTENLLSQINDFPDPFYNYKDNGFKVELLGKETKEGTECFKIKLTKTPITVAGKKEDNVVFYYFDTENFVPIMTEAEVKEGPAKGQMSTSTMGDYQEVDGVYFPFSMTQRLKDGQGQTIEFEKVVLNGKFEDKIFVFPGDK